MKPFTSFTITTQKPRKPVTIFELGEAINRAIIAGRGNDPLEFTFPVDSHYEGKLVATAVFTLNLDESNLPTL